MPEIDDEAVTNSELLQLLATSIKCAEVARGNLRFDFFNKQQRFCVGLHCVVIEHAKAIRLIVTNELYYAPTVLHRAVLDAFVDITLVCKDRKYCDNLELDDAMAWSKMLEVAKQGNNPYLKVIAESPYFESGRIQYANTVRELRARKIKRLDQEKRFELAEMPHEYDAVHRMLSAESHNNASFITNHYFDANAEPILLRPVGHKPGNGAPKAVLLNVPEIVLAATGKVLRLCGHGIAVMSEAQEMFDRIYAKVVAADSVEREAGEHDQPIN